MRAANAHVSLCIYAVSPEPSMITHKVGKYMFGCLRMEIIYMFCKFYAKFVHLIDGIIEHNLHLIQLFVQVAQ